MKNYTLEVCVDAFESAISADKAGAHRLELCGDLVIGGITPHHILFEQIRRVSDIDMRVMIRPRFGDFCYTDSEFEIMENCVSKYRELGAEGVVFGILLPNGQLDVERMKRLCEKSGDMKVTLHRAFDVCRDPFEVLEEAKKLGISTILTSGQKSGAEKGMKLLAELNKQSGDIEILVGSSVTPDNIEKIWKATGITSYHLSGKKIIQSKMEFRQDEVSMGLPGLSEFEQWRCDEEIVEKAKKVLESL